VQPSWELLQRTERFVARHYSRPLLGICAGLVLAGCVALAVEAVWHQRPVAQAVIAVGGLALFGVLPLLLLGETYCVYEVTPTHLELQRWTGRRTRVLWPEVVTIRALSTPTTGFSITLVDRQQHRINVDAEVPEGRRLLGLVFGHLSGAGKDQMLREALARGGAVVTEAEADTAPLGWPEDAIQ